MESDRTFGFTLSLTSYNDRILNNYIFSRKLISIEVRMCVKRNFNFTQSSFVSLLEINSRLHTNNYLFRTDKLHKSIPLS